MSGKDQNSQQLHGRVIDVVIQSPGEFSLVVVCGWKLHEFRGHSTTVPRVGDLVLIEFLCDEDICDFKVVGRNLGEWDPLGDCMRWRQPGMAPSRLELLHKRQLIVRAIRDYFYHEDFLDIDAPLLVRGACPDIALNPIPVGNRFLTTSTEYHIKRMVVGGVERAFTLTHNFRADEIGQLHNPEFTMVEWARVHASLEDIEEDARKLITAAFKSVSANKKTLNIGPHCVQIFRKPWERLSIREGLHKHLGVKIDALFSLESLKSACNQLHISLSDLSSCDQHDLITILTNALLPFVGTVIPTFLVDWPTFMTSSAEIRSDNAAITKRSELIIAGIEISDGFPFLTGFETQRRQFEQMLDRRSKLCKPPVTLDTAYLSALAQGIPPGAGMALGVDRLVMLLTNQSSIRNVIPFAWDEL